MSSPRRRPPVPPFSSFAWSFAGAILIALSLPPLGLYPLAWVALVPFLMRWAHRKATMDYARELYALLLTTSCCVGFWLLFNPDPQSAALGGASLFLAPIPMTVAFALAGLVKDRLGIAPGLVALTLNVLAAEFVTVHLTISLPWLLLGHTQVEALEFIQMADIGGVLLLSLWVLLLNGTVFLALPRSPEEGIRIGERGASIAVFSALVALPVAYGSIRTAQSDVPAGFARIGIVQPGLPPADWDRRDGDSKVQYLASLSDDLVRRWQPSAYDSSFAAIPSRSGSESGLIVWPQTSLPWMRSERDEQQLHARLTQWAARRDVALLAGATVDGSEDGKKPSMSSAAILIRPGKPIVQYEQMRRVRVADTEAAHGTERVLFDTGGTKIATAVGFESVFGDHIRKFTADGANLMVVMSRNDVWGRSAGMYQHLMFTRMRAIESRRAVLLSTVSGVSAMILPSGHIDETLGWMDQEAISIDVPTFRHQTFYVRHGDWVGRWAVGLGLAFNLGALFVIFYMPRLVPQPKRRPISAPLPFR